jgi:dolichol-phosphate mannosyltransferase
MTLGPTGWEVIFVDDNSPDGTSVMVRGVARVDPRVRCIQRIGRRGLSSACIEGMMATSAPIIAVMDADLQHDETLLPKMLEEIAQKGADVVIGTRYGLGGTTGNWSKSREAMSRLATMLSRLILKREISDPMSGMFMLQRNVLEATVHNLSGVGFKILLDILATAKLPLKISEVPYHFRERFAGESKLDGMVIWEYGLLLADKLVGRFIPIRFVAFAVVGGLGVLVHMSVLAMVFKILGIGFTSAQSFSTGVSMIFNFALNNLLTYSDRRLRGWRWVKGLLIFMIVCSIGAIANVGIATALFENHTQWIIAALGGVLVGAVWNYAATQFYVWGEAKRR